MWTLLYQLGSPKTFYYRSNQILPWLLYGSIMLLSVGIIWGLFFSPADYQQGDAFRIIYIHVPCAFLSLSIYAAMAFLAILLLVWRIKLAGMMLQASVEVGLTMVLLALVTGSVWGKPMWGTWWVWDARLTSELILLFLYAAILATGRSYQHKEKSEKMMAILTLVGLVDLPIIHYSVYWWNTLHQGATLTLFAKPKIALPMIWPLLFTLVGFSLYCLSLIILRAQSRILIREKKQSWIKKMAKGA